MLLTSWVRSFAQTLVTRRRGFRRSPMRRSQGWKNAAARASLVEALETRQLLTALVIDQQYVADHGNFVNIQNVDLDIDSDGIPEFDSIVIDTVSVQGAGLGIDITLSDLTLNRIALKDVDINPVGSLVTGVDINLTNVTLNAIVVETSNLTSDSDPGLDITLTDVLLDELAVYQSVITGGFGPGVAVTVASQTRNATINDLDISESTIDGVSISSTGRSLSVFDADASSTLTNPIIITAVDHSLQNNTDITVSGVNGVPGANTRATLTVIDENRFSLTGTDSSAGGVYINGGTVDLATSIGSVRITRNSITGNNGEDGLALTLNNASTTNFVVEDNITIKAMSVTLTDAPIDGLQIRNNNVDGTTPQVEAMRFSLTRSPLTNLNIEANNIQGPPAGGGARSGGDGIVFEAVDSNVYGTIDRNTINNTLGDGIRLEASVTPGFVTQNRGPLTFDFSGFSAETTLTQSITSTSTTLSVVDGRQFQSQQFVLIDNEVMYITGVTGNTLTVIRGERGTLPLRHDANTRLRSVTSARSGSSRAISNNIVTNNTGAGFSVDFDTNAAIKTDITKNTFSGNQTRAIDVTVKDTRAATATLARGGISRTATTLNLNDASPFANFLLPFNIQVEGEELTVTAVAGSSLTVTRGVNSTAAAFHATNTPVVVSTGDGLDLDIGGEDVSLRNTFTNNRNDAILVQLVDAAAGRVGIKNNIITGGQQTAGGASDADAIAVRLQGTSGQEQATAILRRSEISGNLIGVARTTTLTSNISAGATVFAVADSSFLNLNDLIRIDGEEMRISQDPRITAATRTIVVQRGQNGTAAVAHSASTLVIPTIGGNQGRGVDIISFEKTGLEDLQITNNVIANNSDDGVRIRREGEGTTETVDPTTTQVRAITIQSNVINHNALQPSLETLNPSTGNQTFGAGIEVIALHGSLDTLDVDIRQNTIIGNRRAAGGGGANSRLEPHSVGVSLRAEADGIVQADVIDNIITHNEGNGLYYSTREESFTDQRDVGGQVLKNTIAFNGLDGIEFGGHFGIVNLVQIGKEGTDPSDGRSWGNVISNNGDHGIHINHGGNLAVVNNTISSNGANPSRAVVPLGQASPGGGGGEPGISTAIPGSGIFLYNADPVFSTPGNPPFSQLFVNIVVDKNTIQSNRAMGIDLNAQISVPNVFSTIRDNLISLNQLDGIELSGALHSTMLHNTLDRNVGRGLDIMNYNTSDSNYQIGNGLESGRNTFIANGQEGIYYLTSAEAQDQNLLSSNPLSVNNVSTAFFTRPEAILQIDTNTITDNGTNNTTGFANTGIIGAIGGSSGLVMRIGSVDAPPSPYHIVWGVGETAGVGEPNGLPYTGNIGNAFPDNGRTNARVTNNSFEGNFGADVTITPFRSTANPPTTGGVWGRSETPNYALGGFTGDPLSRLNLQFQGNSGNGLDVQSNALVGYTNAEGVFKSRDGAEQGGDRGGDIGPFVSITRPRSVTQIPSRMTQGLPADVSQTGRLAGSLLPPGVEVVDPITGVFTIVGGPNQVYNTRARIISVTDATDTDNIIIEIDPRRAFLYANNTQVQVAGVRGLAANGDQHTHPANGQYRVRLIDGTHYELVGTAGNFGLSYDPSSFAFVSEPDFNDLGELVFLYPGVGPSTFRIAPGYDTSGNGAQNSFATGDNFYDYTLTNVFETWTPINELNGVVLNIERLNIPTVGTRAVITTPNHGLTDGRILRFDGITGAEEVNTDQNSFHVVRYINDNQFFLEGVAVFDDNYLMGGEWRTVDDSFIAPRTPTFPVPSITSVSPDPRTSDTGIVTVTFTEPVADVDTDDFILRRDGVPVDISGIPVIQTGPKTVTLDLSSVTDDEGEYTLSQDNTAPVALFTELPQSALSGPVGTVTITFSENVTGVDITDFALLRDLNDGNGFRPVNLSHIPSSDGTFGANLVVNQVSPRQYSIDLTRVTDDVGDYRLSLLAPRSDFTVAPTEFPNFLGQPIVIRSENPHNLATGMTVTVDQLGSVIAPVTSLGVPINGRSFVITTLSEYEFRLNGTVGNGLSTANGRWSYTSDIIDETGRPFAVNFRDEIADERLDWSRENTVPTADIVDISPDPRATTVDTVTVEFSEPVRIANVNTNDFRLTRVIPGGTTQVPISFAGSGVTVSAIDPDASNTFARRFRLNNFGSLTGADGFYRLTLITTDASRITDRQGSVLATPALDEWTIVRTGPFPTIQPVAPVIRRTGVDNVTFTFTSAVNGIPNGAEAGRYLVLTQDGVNVPLVDRNNQPLRILRDSAIAYQVDLFEVTTVATAASTLADAVTASDLQIRVTNPAVFPSVAPFDIRIGNEELRVTGIAGDLFDIERALHRTIASDYNPGAAISLVTPKDGDFLLTLPHDQVPVAGLLNDTVAANAAVISISDTQHLPTTAPFELRIDNEIVQVTAINGNQLNVTRGRNGTTAATHLAGAAIRLLTSLAANGNPLVVSSTLTWRQDATVPTADIDDVDPEPRIQNAGLVTLSFSEPVTGVDRANAATDFELTLDIGDESGAQPISLSGIQVRPINPTLADGTPLPSGNPFDNTVDVYAQQYLLDLRSITTVDGIYRLSMKATGSITDLPGNPFATSTTSEDTWTLLPKGPDTIINDSTLPRRPVIIDPRQPTPNFVLQSSLQLAFVANTAKGDAIDRFFVDRTPPEVVDGSVDVQPEVRSNSAGVLTIVFNEPVTGFNLTDLVLRRDDSAVSLNGLTLNPLSATEYSIDLNLVTGAPGKYEFYIQPQDSLIRDAAGNDLQPEFDGNGQLLNDGLLLLDAWEVQNIGPTAAITVLTPRRTAATDIVVTFSKPISVAQFNTHPDTSLSDLQLLRDTGDGSGFQPVSITASSIIPRSPSGGFASVFDVNLGVAAGVTDVPGNYRLTLRAKDSAITDEAGIELDADATATWTLDNVAPVGDVIDVFPDPLRSGQSAGIVNILFTEPVTGVDATDFALTLDGTPVAIPSGLFKAETSRRYILDLNTNTKTDGKYKLTLLNDGSILDLAGNVMATTASDEWEQGLDTKAPTVTIVDIDTPRNTPAGVVSINFSEDVTGVDIFDLQLTINRNDGKGAQTIPLVVTSKVAGSIDASTTELKLNSVAGFPTETPFEIRVENEIMLVSAVDETTLTVSRGQQGTAAAAHNDAVSVRAAAVEFDNFPGSESEYRVDLSPLTIGSGEYTLTLLTSDTLTPIKDKAVTLAGVPAPNALVTGDTMEWTNQLIDPSATILPVTPDPRLRPVSSVIINFTQPVSGVDGGDFVLTRNGQQVSLRDVQPVVGALGPSQYVLDLTSVTGTAGSYRLQLVAANSGIQQIGTGSPLLNDSAVTWTTITEINVNTTNDTVDSAPGNGGVADSNGAISLRAAVMEAGSLPGDDVINLGAETYRLVRPGTGEELGVNGDLDIFDTAGVTTIRGESPALTIIDAGQLERIFHVTAGAELVLENVTIRGGLVTGSEDGGALRNDGGVVTLRNVIIIDNESKDDGGAINNDGTLLIVDSTISRNKATNNGGAIRNVGALRIESSLIGGVYTPTTTPVVDNRNKAGISGGGIVNLGNGTVTIVNSTLSGNAATNNTGNGGAISNQAPLPNISGFLAAPIALGQTTVLVADPTVFPDQEVFDIQINAEQMRVTQVSNATFTVTRGVNGTAPAIHATGALVTVRSNLNLVNTTITNNQAGNVGGGLHISNGRTLIQNTIISGSNAVTVPANGPDVWNNNAAANTFTLVSLGGNIIGRNNGATGVFAAAQPVAPGDVVGTVAAPIDAKIDLNLADNGGPTLTHAVLAGSFAIGRGTTQFSEFDQRGITRALDTVDSGAVEFGGFFVDAPFGDQEVDDNPDVAPGDGIVADKYGRQTLRAAIMEANAQAGANAIKLADNTTYALSTGVLDRTAPTVDISDVNDLQDQASKQDPLDSIDLQFSEPINATLAQVLANLQLNYTPVGGATVAVPLNGVTITRVKTELELVSDIPDLSKYTLTGLRGLLAADGLYEFRYVTAPAIADFENNLLADDKSIAIAGVAAIEQFVRGEDKFAPTAVLSQVTPTPRTTKPGAVTLTFSEAVLGVDLAAGAPQFTLTYDNGTGPVPISLASIAVQQQTTSQFTLDLTNVVIDPLLGTGTDSPGTYTLTFNSGGQVTDFSQNAYAGGALGTTWVVVPDTVPPTATITAITPDPRLGRVGLVTITFDEAVTGIDESNADLYLDLVVDTDGSDPVRGPSPAISIPLVDANGDPLPITPGSDGVSYTLDLTSVTLIDGWYTLTLNPNAVNTPGIFDTTEVTKLTPNGANKMVAGTSTNWVIGDDVSRFTNQGLAVAPAGQMLFDDAASFGDLDITGGTLTILGSESAVSTIDATQLDRVFDVYAGVTLNLNNVTLSNGSVLVTRDGGAIRNSGVLNIADSVLSASTAGGRGGAIFSTGIVSISGSASQIQNNTANFGGGIYNDNFGTLTLDEIVLSENRATRDSKDLGGDGGAIFNDRQGTFTAVGVSILGNTAERHGGGFYNNDSSIASIADSTISSNSATGDISKGGAIFNELAAQLTIDNSTFAANEAQFGGALYDQDGSVDVRRSALSANHARSSGGAVFVTSNGTVLIDDSTVSSNSAVITGGAIDNNGTLTVTASKLVDNEVNGSGLTEGSGGAVNNTRNLTIRNTTVSGNSATSDGGGIRNSDNGSVTLANAVVTDNTAGRHGGSVLNLGNTSLVVTATTISNSKAGASGGGLYLGSTGTVTFDSSTVSGNAAANGGGIFSTTSFLFTNSTLSSNSASETGGGLRNAGGVVTLQNATVFGNSAGRLGGGIRNSGQSRVSGITSLSTTITRDQTTIGVANGALLPTTVPFVIRVDNEDMRVDAVSGNSLTVTRGVNGTARATHNAGVSVRRTFAITDTVFPLDDLTTLAAQAGTQLRIGNEDLQITNITGNTVTVTRAVNGTVAGQVFGGDTATLAETLGTVRLKNTIVAQGVSPTNPDISGIQIVNDGNNLIGDLGTTSNGYVNGVGGIVGGLLGTPKKLVVQSISNSSPMTVTTTTDHGYNTGDRIRITGALGNTAANGEFDVTVTGNRTLQLRNLDGTPAVGNGTYTSGANILVGVTDISQTAPMRVTTGEVHGLTENSRVRIRGAVGNTAANGVFLVQLTNDANAFELLNLDGTPAASNGVYARGAEVIVVVDPLLGPLQANGGPTQTHSLLFGSPARDQGSNVGVPATDQRGFARIFDGDGNGLATVDIGAFESGFVVNTFLDTIDVRPGDRSSADQLGNSSLRAAVMEANSLDGDDTILLLPGTFTLTIAGRDENVSAQGDLDITNDSLTIIGAGPDQTVIDAAKLDRVFHVLAGASLNLKNLTVKGGVALLGGGILNQGTLTLENVVLEGNQADFGGGVYNDRVRSQLVGAIGSANNTIQVANPAIFPSVVPYDITIDSERLRVINVSTANNTTTLTVTRGVNGTTAVAHANLANVTVVGAATITSSTIRNNESRLQGGGVFSISPLTVNVSSISNNNSNSQGGGLFNRGTADITDSTLDANLAAGTGGGIFNDGTGAGEIVTMTLDGVTLSRNEAGIRGGAIYNNDRIVILNSTISSNSSAAIAGAIFNGPHATPGIGTIGDMTITNTSIVLNETDGVGGGVVNVTPARVSVRNTIISGNTAGAEDRDVRGTFVSLGANFVGDAGTSSGFINNSNGDQVGSTASPFDAVFGRLGNNGGPTQTHALLTGSPAIDRGNNSGGEPVDQRGGRRPTDTDADVGAFEVQENRISIFDVTADEGDTGQTEFVFAVVLARVSAEPITVKYRTEADSAKTGSDFIGQEGVLTFQPGELTKTITIEVNGDITGEQSNVANDAERFYVRLFDAVNATLDDGDANTRNDDLGTGIIINDDAYVSVSDISITEGNGGNTSKSVEISLDAPSKFAITVNYSTFDGTAMLLDGKGRADYVQVSGTVTFAPGELVKTIPVQVVGDRVLEADENFVLRVTSAVDSQGDAIPLAKPDGKITILNDDRPVTEWLIRQDATHSFIEVFRTDPGLAPVAVPGSTTTNLVDAVNVTGSSAADTFIIDYVNGIPIPANGLTIDGGAEVNPLDVGVDTIQLVNGTVTNIVYTATGGESGTITIDGRVVTYSELEPIIDFLTAQNRTVTLTDAIAHKVELSDDASEAGHSLIRSLSSPATFESISFTNPSTSLTINLGSGDNTATLLSVDAAFGATLTLNAGAGKDTVDATGMTYPMAINGEAGDDFLVGGNANDTINGGEGLDTLSGFGGGDLLDGGNGNDSLVGGLGNDTLLGQAGDDVLMGEDGDDSLEGGENDDIVDGGTGINVLRGGNGIDRLDLVLTTAINVTLTNTALTIDGISTSFDSLEAFKLTMGSGDNSVNAENYTAGPVTLVGGEGADTLRGGSGDDQLEGGLGNDVIIGNAGNDSVLAGGGNDSVDGGAGFDTVLGNHGVDTILGGTESDLLQGDESNDLIFGGDGDDILDGEEADDTLDGQGGNDVIYGRAGADSIVGGLGADQIYGGDDGDNISGGLGDDFISADMGRDTADGGAGNDTIFGGGNNDTMIAGEGIDVVDGQAGSQHFVNGILAEPSRDTLQLPDGTTANETYTVSYSAGFLQLIKSNGTGYTVMLRRTEAIVLNTGGGADVFTVGNVTGTTDFVTANIFLGDGNDTFSAAGNTYSGFATNINGGAGNDLLSGGSGISSFDGDVGNDTLVGGIAADFLAGADGDDFIYGGAGNDTIRGSNGADYIRGNGGNDNVDGGEGNDLIKGDAGNDILDGGFGDDRVGGDAGNDAIYGNLGNDTLKGDDGNDYIDGGNGSDLIRGGAGNDRVNAGLGRDTVLGDDGNDTLSGNNDPDIIIGGLGNDIIFGNGGVDTLTGGSGAGSAPGASETNTIVEVAEIDNFFVLPQSLLALFNF